MINPYYKQIKIFNETLKDLTENKILIFLELCNFRESIKNNMTDKEKFILSILESGLDAVQYEIDLLLDNRPRLKILNKEIDKCHTMN